MSVGLLLVTHGNLGKSLLSTAKQILGVCPLPVRCLAVDQDTDPLEALTKGHRLLEELDTGAGVLILTDCFGSTPSNVAIRLATDHSAAVIAGVNLPMILRVLNYPQLPWQALQEKAISGGRDGVLLVDAHEEGQRRAGS